MTDTYVPNTAQIEAMLFTDTDISAAQTFAGTNLEERTVAWVGRSQGGPPPGAPPGPPPGTPGPPPGTPGGPPSDKGTPILHWQLKMGTNSWKNINFGDYLCENAAGEFFSMDAREFEDKWMIL